MNERGYSGTPLAKKLGMKDGFDVLFVNHPDHYFDLFLELPKIYIVKRPKKESVDLIHFFCKETREFEELSLQLKSFLKKSGMLWVSWPKGSSKIETDLSRDPIRNFLLTHGLVDVKVCAVDADWSGLKFVYRLKDRTP
jgi:hypothetical protein